MARLKPADFDIVKLLRQGPYGKSPHTAPALQKLDQYRLRCPPPYTWSVWAHSHHRAAATECLSVSLVPRHRFRGDPADRGPAVSDGPLPRSRTRVFRPRVMDRKIEMYVNQTSEERGEEEGSCGTVQNEDENIFCNRLLAVLFRS